MNALEILLAKFHNYDIAALILRLAVGILMLAHGIMLLKNGIGGIEAVMLKNGLPKFIAYGIYIGELVAPVFLIIGLWTRFWALMVFITMLVAVLLVYPNSIVSLGKHGVLLELNYLYLFGSLAIFFLGSGRFSAKN